MSTPATEVDFLVCARVADTEPDDIVAGAVCCPCGACGAPVVVSRSGQAARGRQPGLKLRCEPCAMATATAGAEFSTVPGGVEEAARHFARKATQRPGASS